MPIRLEIHYLKVVVNNAFPRYRNDWTALGFVKDRIEDKMNYSAHRTNKLEEKIITAIRKGDDLQSVYSTLIRIFTQRTTGCNLLMAILMAMFYHVRCGKELAARGWITRKEEKKAILDILVETCISLRELKHDSRFCESLARVDEFFGEKKQKYDITKQCAIIAVGVLVFYVQKLTLNLMLENTIDNAF